MRTKRHSLLTGLMAGALAMWGLNALTATPRVAEAQVPDAGAQRAEMITQMRSMNDKLANIAGLLTDIRDGKSPKKKDAEQKP
jgi:hypothetical protein